MSLFTVDELVDGEYAVAAEINAMFNAIAAILNGGIVDENVDAAAAITPSKIAGGAPVKIATTVAGLGTPFAGMTGMLRLGSSPYEYLPVIYDPTYSKWVSLPEWTSLYGYGATDFRSTTHTAYLPTPCRLFVKNWKAIHDAGMRLQVAYSLALATGDSGVQAQVGVNVYDHDATDTLNELTTGYDAQNTVSTTFVYISRDWAQPALVPTQAHGRLAIGWRPQANTTYAQVNDMSLGYRFASA